MSVLNGSEAHQDKKERSAHYREVTPEPIAVISSWLTDEQFIGFCVGTTLKYLGRYNLKADGKGGRKTLIKHWIIWSGLANDALNQKDS